MTNDLVDELLDVANRISRGETPEYQHNECFTSGAFDLLLVKAKGAVAFELLAEVCGRYDAVKASGQGLKGYYHLLSLLAHQSNTTEMSDGMQHIIRENPQLSRDLREWYRVSG